MVLKALAYMLDYQNTVAGLWLSANILRYLVIYVDQLSKEGEDNQEEVVNEDEDRRNPQYIPKKGMFYEHDDRMTEAPDEGEAEKKERWAIIHEFNSKLVIRCHKRSSKVTY